MKYDKQWYVNQHRKMWNWIADQIEANQDVCLDITELKSEYCNLHSLFPWLGCFACEYKSGKGSCREACLFSWGDSPKFVHCLDGYYGQMEHKDDWKEQAALARKIANLPVREELNG